MLWAQSSEKENEFTMSMQIRPRAEYRNGAQFPRFEGDKAYSLRDDFEGEGERLFQAGDAEGVDAIGHIEIRMFGAVSYTHLDVYKRQPPPIVTGR